MKKDVAACGIHCGSCKSFRLECNTCLGCDWANRKLKEVRESHRGCVFWECVRKKNAESCFLCKEFPCKTHYDSNEAVYTKQALDMWKQLGETGLSFGSEPKRVREQKCI